MTKYHNQQYRSYLQEREELLRFLKFHTYENRNKDFITKMELIEDDDSVEGLGLIKLHFVRNFVVSTTIYGYGITVFT